MSVAEVPTDMPYPEEALVARWVACAHPRCNGVLCIREIEEEEFWFRVRDWGRQLAFSALDTGSERC
jgi:hypothetical protein